MAKRFKFTDTDDLEDIYDTCDYFESNRHDYDDKANAAQRAAEDIRHLAESYERVTEVAERLIDALADAGMELFCSDEYADVIAWAEQRGLA